MTEWQIPDEPTEPDVLWTWHPETGEPVEWRRWQGKCNPYFKGWVHPPSEVAIGWIDLLMYGPITDRKPEPEDCLPVPPQPKPIRLVHPIHRMVPRAKRRGLRAVANS